MKTLPNILKLLQFSSLLLLVSYGWATENNTSTLESNLRTTFANTPPDNCPELEVDISTALLRPCINNTYDVHYCNNGLFVASNAKLRIKFDRKLLVQSNGIDLPYTFLGNNEYLIELGDIQPGVCNEIQVQTALACDTVEGMTHCTEAEITADNFCTPSLNSDGSIIDGNASCEDDSIRFELLNIGESMSQELYYIVIEDEALRMILPSFDLFEWNEAEIIHSNIVIEDEALFFDANILNDIDVSFIIGTFQLAAGGKKEIKVESNNSTWWLLTPQSYTELDRLVTQAAMEGCGTELDEMSVGHITQMPQNDLANSVSIDCQENVSSIPMIEKKASPLGINVGEENLIAHNTALDYYIRFQNTEDESISTIYIKDTLSSLLDTETLRMGASNHDYSWSLNGNVLTVAFEDINLPSSAIDEVGSYGYIKFKIDLKSGIAEGSILSNRATVYFDQLPMTSNEVIHNIEITPSILVTQMDVCESNYSGEIPFFPFPNGDILDITYLNIIENEETIIDTLIYSCNEYEGITYSQDTTLIDFYIATTGCDSLVITNIEVDDCPTELTIKPKELIIYPNPSINEVHININVQQQKDIQFKLYNTLGQSVKTVGATNKLFEGWNQYTLQIDHLDSGTYFLEIVMDEQKIMKKILKRD